MKVQKCVTDQLYNLSISKEWKYNGRPCSPRVLFVYESSTIEYDPEELVENTGYRTRPQVSNCRLTAIILDCFETTHVLLL